MQEDKQQIKQVLVLILGMGLELQQTVQVKAQALILQQEGQIIQAVETQTQEVELILLVAEEGE
jgi:hypothetical protein